jgi:hydroxyacylglutathione hydrolase
MFRGGVITFSPLNMATIPLEDSFSDVAQKAQRGLKLSDADLFARSGASPEGWARIKAGELDEETLARVAGPLGLHAPSLLALARKQWLPQPVQLEGLAAFNTPYEDMTVNSYLVYDPGTRDAAVFDTGADAAGMLALIRERNLTVRWILLTHTHGDHIADLARLKRETGAPARVSKLEPVEGAEPIAEGAQFTAGGLRIEARQTTGHSVGGITYVVNGLARPVAVVGDALFAGSMGGGLISYADALQNNRSKIFTLPPETVVCPGHGPMTTVGEEKANNPFYPEFKSS